MTVNDFLLAQIAKDELVVLLRDCACPPEIHWPHCAVHVLRECEAKRKMVDLHQHRHAGQPCGTLRLLAFPYADRRGWREEWLPSDETVKCDC